MGNAPALPSIAAGKAWLLPDREFALSDHLGRETFGKACPGDLREAKRWLAEEKGLPPLLVESVLEHLTAMGGPCDCLALTLLVKGAPEGPDGPLEEDPLLAGWCIPARFQPKPGRVHRKLLRAGPVPLGHGYARDGELLVPAPGMAPRERVLRRSVHFFLGLETGLPAEHGVLSVEPDPWTAGRLVAAVTSSAARDALEDFGLREAAFFLDALDRCEAGHFVGVKLQSVLHDEALVPELHVSRVIPRWLET